MTHRRQERCKLFGMQSVSDRRRVIAAYDPKVHLAPWHNDRPFVLGLYDRRIKVLGMSYDLRRGRKIRHMSPGTERVLEEGRWKGNGVDHVVLPLQYELHQSTSSLL